MEGRYESLDTVSEIEGLTIGLSRKIWRKTSLLRAQTREGWPPLPTSR